MFQDSVLWNIKKSILYQKVLLPIDREPTNYYQMREKTTLKAIVN